MLDQHPGGLALTKRAIDYCAFPLGATVVDVGCGTGTTVEYLSNYCGVHAAGVDLSAPRLEQGRKRSAGLLFIQGTAERLPFADASVDGAIAECSLSVMQHTGTVVGEISRILIDRGKLAVTDLYVKNPGDPSAACHLPVADSKTSHMAGKDLLSMLEKNGFQIIVWEDQSIFLQEFVARYIMEHGSIEQLWQCISGNNVRKNSGEAINRAKLGYFLLVAEKRKTGGRNKDGGYYMPTLR